MNQVERIIQLSRMVSQTHKLIDEHVEKRERVVRNIYIRMNFTGRGYVSEVSLQDLRSDYIQLCEKISALNEQRNALMHEMTVPKK